jgi:hypothetical protein
MQPITFPIPKFVILHGNTPDPVLIACNPPAKVWTAQPSIEPFDDPQAAIDRAIELNVPPLLTQEFWPVGKSFNLVTRKLVDLPDPIPAWDAATTYAPGDVVRHTLTQDINGEQVSTELTFLKISDAHPSTPDLVFDLEAGTGDWVQWSPKEPPPAPPEPTPEQKLAALEARLAALEAASHGRPQA